MRLKNKTLLKLMGITPPFIVDGYRRLRQIWEGKKAPRTYRLSSGEIYYSGKGVGGMWDEIGNLQFNFLVANGLQPHQKLLDIGCGSLRGGVHSIKYLNDGNYYGIDMKQWLLTAAVEVELPRYGLTHKTVHLLRRDDFDFSLFGAKFDYAIAQSVFTHIPRDLVLRCLINIEKVFKKDSRFFATFWEDKRGDHIEGPLYHIPGGEVTFPDKDPFHYKFDVLVELAKIAFLEVEYIGKWNHPRNQMMVAFTKPKKSEES